MEFENMNEVYNYITKGQLKKNNKAYFYPVLLVYGKENIYDEKILLKLKRTNKISYELLLEECDKLVFKVNNKPKEKPLTQEEIDKNMRELYLAQIRYERQRDDDELYPYIMNNENGNGSSRKLNIINNEPRKNRISNTNNFLNSFKDNKRKTFNPYNYENNLQKRNFIGNHYGYGYNYYPY